MAIHTFLHPSGRTEVSVFTSRGMQSALFMRMQKVVFALLTVFTSLSHALDYHVASDQGVNVVHMQGFIEVTEARRINYVLSSLDLNQNTLFVIDSPGGAGYMGLFLAKRLTEFVEAQKAQGKRVAVLVSKQCSSICVPVYYAFEERFATPQARFGFHSGATGGFGNDDQLTQAFLTDITERAQQRQDALTLAWILDQKNKGTFRSRDLVVFKTSELLEMNAGLVTDSSVVTSEDHLTSNLR